MVYGISKYIRKMLFFANISNLAAYYKRGKLLRKYSKNEVSIGLKSSIINSKLNKRVFIGARVTIYNSSLGDYSYVNSDTFIRDVNIGKFCSIGSKVIFGLGKHPVDLVSTHPAFYSNNKGYKTFANKDFFQEYFPIKIGNDVWIGYGAIIMGGVQIGDGAVIAAGAVVTKNIEPYSIAGGIPAKHIKFRFDKNTIKKLLSIKWWDFEEKWFEENFLLFHDTNKFIRKFEG